MKPNWNISSNFISREILIEVNSLGLITFITSNCYESFGYTDSQMVDTLVGKYLSVDIHNIKSEHNTQIELIKSTGENLYFDMFIHPFKSKDDLYNYKISLIDVSKFVSKVNEYHNFTYIIEKSKDIIYSMEVKPELKFTYVSPSIVDIMGVTAEECYNNSNICFEVLHPDDLATQLSKLDKHTDFSKPIVTRFKNADGSYVWIEDYIIPTFDNNGEIIKIDGISRNIQDRKILEEKLKILSYIDGLTNLYNRNYLNEKIDYLINKSNVPIAVIFCDLDNLKHTNDTYGHFAGDSILKNFGKLLAQVFDSISCVVARNGGDEFVILITDTSLQDAQNLYSSMFKVIESYNNSNKLPIQLSSGFSYSSSSKNILEELNKADKYMYKNKFNKKSQTVLL